MCPVTVHRAKWVFPVSRPVIDNGALIVGGDYIISAGCYKELGIDGGANVIDHGEVVLMPGLVNAHAHLELSALRQLGKEKHRFGFITWVRKLLECRNAIGEKKVNDSYGEALGEIHNCGTAVIADVGNDPGSYNRLKNFTGHGLFSLEILGFSAGNLSETIAGTEPVERMMRKTENSGARGTSFQLAAHAVYSTSPEVICQVKHWNSSCGKKMSIHVSEHPEEIEFLMTGQGDCRYLLEERGQWNSSWSVPGCSPVEYLNNLAVLDESTICVHLVLVTDGDIRTLAAKETPVVVCPRSNLSLTDMLPPVKKFIDSGITWGIGTDSLASNTDLNLFGEMSVLVDDLELDPEIVLSASTLGGAKVLGIDKYFGSLEAGKKACVIKIPVQADSREEVPGEIIEKGRMGEIQWLS